MTTQGTHEDLSRHEIIEGPSDRRFGYSFAIIFAIIAFAKFYLAQPAALWWLVAAAVTASIGTLAPAALAPLNRAWLGLGLLLHKVVNPVIMAILFLLTITPIGLLMRAAGKDFLRLRLDSAATSYWIKREPPGPSPETMTNQF